MVMYEVMGDQKDAGTVQRQAQTCLTLNACPGGILISTNQMLPLELELVITMSTFTALQPIKVSGLVKWAKQITEHEYQIGIAFKHLLDVDKTNLTNVLSLVFK